MMHLLWNDEVPFYDPSIDQPKPSLTSFLLEGKERRGAVIVCPGGGYEMLCDYEGDPISERINGLGFHAFTLWYRHSPYRHPVPLTDIQRAIRYVRYHADEFGVKPDKIAVLGFSAGGHLACTAATHYDSGIPDAPDPVDRVSSRPDAFIPCYAVSDLSGYSHAGTIHALTGSEQPSRELLKFLSAPAQVTADTPPAFIWHTAEDELVPVESSLQLALALTAHSVPYSLHVFPRGPHGIAQGTGYPLAPQWIPLMGEFLSDLGF